MILEELNAELGFQQKQFNIGRVEFDYVVKRLTPNLPVYDTMVAAGQLRNTVGHKISWETASLDEASYELAVKVISSKLY